MVVADLDMALINKRKRMMDSVGHYARPELLHLVMDASAHTTLKSGDAALAAADATSDTSEAIPLDPKVALNVREKRHDTVQPAAVD